MKDQDIFDDFLSTGLLAPLSTGVNWLCSLSDGHDWDLGSSEIYYGL